MKTLKAVRGNRRIVYETLPTGTRMINWRCWSSPFYLRLWVKNNLKISLLLFSPVAVLNETGFSSGLVNESCNDLHLAPLYHGQEEYSFSSEFELYTKGAEKLQTNTPRKLDSSINLPLWDVGKCLVRLECWAGADTKDEAKDFADPRDLHFARNLWTR